MYLSRIYIRNLRNFSELDIALKGSAIFVGENRVGKSNLLHGLRLILDPSLPDSARQLRIEDFWDGAVPLDAEDRIIISIELREFDKDLDVLAVLTDFRLDKDENTVRLTYEFRPVEGLEGDPTSDSDYEFICYGGESDTKRFGHDLRRRISLDILPALRDAETDLATWRRSPLRPLLETALASVDTNDLESIGDAVKAATEKLGNFKEVKDLETEISNLLKRLSGANQDLQPRLGFVASDPTRLFRSIQLLIDDGKRGIHDASLGSANLVFLGLKALELNRTIEENVRDHTFLAIEEPEAHLHPHLQRCVYRQLFETATTEDQADRPLSVLLTTHSPHIASIAPIRSLVVLKETDGAGTQGRSTAELALTPIEAEDLARYLDVTRAEFLFARGVILVEGDAERFLVPAFASGLGISLDELGISVCSIAGTNFQPYAKFLANLDIPFAIITDWDPGETEHPLGYNRALKLVESIETIRRGKTPAKLLKELSNLDDYDDFGKRCEEFGIFTNNATLEVDLFECFGPTMISLLRTAKFGTKRSALLDKWEADPKTLNPESLLSMLDTVGKGRFAQRLAAKLGESKAPPYIESAILYIVDRV